MISRDLANTQTVHAFNPPSTGTDPTAFCIVTLAGTTCTAAGTLSTAALNGYGFGGRIIDRLGLAENYNAVVPVVSSWGEVEPCATTCVARFLGVSIGLQHSSSTCSADFSNYSTELWQGRRPLHMVGTSTSTAAPLYNSEAFLLSTTDQGLLTTGATTSSGYAVLVGGPAPAFPITGAKRFLRMVVAPHIEGVCTCGFPQLFVFGSLLFGDPDKGVASCTPRGRVVVTCACST